MTIFVLGAPDREMDAIERLVTAAGHTAVYATIDGRRVAPGTAYRAILPRQPVDVLAAVEAGGPVYLVECCDPPAHPGWRRIDHHRPGDPGYGRPPADFLAASSIGQVWLVIHHLTGFYPTDGRWWGGDGTPDYGVEVPERIVLTAAADHCLGHAYAGSCPGVEPDTLMAWDIESMAAFQGRPAADIMADVERARQVLREAPALLAPKHPGIAVDDGAWLAIDWERITRIDYGIRDMRGPVTPELPRAAVRDGFCYIATIPATEREPREKIVCGGSATPQQIEAFRRWAAAEGLVDPYGDPARGFAGAYLPETVVV